MSHISSASPVTRETVPEPPVAKRVPTRREHHGDVFVDQYEWLRDKESPEVVEHLKAENAYQEAVTAHQEPLREAMFQEIKGRTQETDLSVPSRKDGWWYYSRSVEGKEYSIQCRVLARNTGDPVADWTPPAVEAGVELPGEEVLLDGNIEAEGQPFFSVGGAAVTVDGNLYAYAVDNSGDERFTLRIKDLRTGELLPDVIEDIFYGVAFSPDGTRLFYTVVDESWRPYQVKAHVLGTPVTEDEVLYQEDDVAMWLGFDLASDRRHLVLSIGCSEFSETRLLRFDDYESGLSTVIPREEHILYEAEPFLLDGRETLLLTHNKDAINSMVSLVDPAELTKPIAAQNWRTVVAHSDDVRVNGAGVTSTHLVLSIRKDTIERVQVLPLAGLGTPAQGVPVEPAFDEELYTAGVSGSDYEAPVIRMGYTSYFTPSRVYDFVLPTPGLPDGQLLLRKESPVLGGYSSSDYVATREWATADDGTRVPLSVLRHASVQPDGTAAGLVYGYGSYEVSMDPGFGVARLSLLDRGIVMVIAHIRGGGELGRHWYEDGKKLNKKNTFTDFIAATDWLASSGLVDPSRIAAMGGSAGGLLMGAVANMAPEKYAAVVAQVPFVDALTTILDPELPLSALEWEEWGNPITDPQAYAYMKSYTPYENVGATAYPKIAAVTSFNDTRVLYVEPAKWVQALRATSTGTEPIVMKIEMDGGHGGASGRYVQWRERAWDYAFVADSLGATKLLPGAGLK
ncbi:oligopeptidase B [Paenarthrobacter nicotinovorans]|uniref:Oligopeptidase B n=1 Tax=Paenarthrobacter nicotinovorans TaxID=29320 RepID=A0ABT9TG45_PAENI|nr:S9 family peptidase [Paenarthrobacter nicotinovorans]KIA71961.1 protease 2 [Arthrobacter sp. MWB30]BCW11890.1 oligopeptidase B [Arthrobacter sp. NtRootA2]BCW15974.1 oligopeptidase B [Arthrobacter sp. NtRootA4]BCW24307.1 oligopeptidase B [Arthrobacter sp. NtRootC7]BCW28574.1 oligopeptidase B [Arthrobacter sp. NtRootC45]BCW32846.1 oligopeptidase B [Arthrobacter sp. NtRootD5]